MWEACGHASSDHGNTTHGQALQPICCGDLERALLGQRIGIRRTTVAEVFLVDGQLTALHIQAVKGDRVIEVVDFQRQGRRAGIAIGILDCVGEVLYATAATAQIFEARCIGIKCVGVGTIGCQDQRAVGTGEGACNHRPTCYTVGALHVVGQYIARQLHLLFGCGHGIAVVESLRRVVVNDDIQRTLSDIAITVSDLHRKLFGQRLGPIALEVLPGFSERIAIAHLASARVVAGNREDVTQPGRDRLADAGHHAASHHIDAAHAQVKHTILRRHGETTLLRQCSGIAGRAQRQVGLEKAKFRRGDIQPK